MRLGKETLNSRNCLPPQQFEPRELPGATRQLASADDQWMASGSAATPLLDHLGRPRRTGRSRQGATDAGTPLRSKLWSRLDQQWPPAGSRRHSHYSLENRPDKSAWIVVPSSFLEWIPPDCLALWLLSLDLQRLTGRTASAYISGESTSKTFWR
jgi:hypothetical protein